MLWMKSITLQLTYKNSFVHIAKSKVLCKLEAINYELYKLYIPYSI